MAVLVVLNHKGYMRNSVLVRNSNVFSVGWGIIFSVGPSWFEF